MLTILNLFIHMKELIISLYDFFIISILKLFWRIDKNSLNNLKKVKFDIIKIK